MHLGRNDHGVFAEHAGYFGLADIDLSRFVPRRLSMPVVLGHHAVEHSQITKQADVVMALVLLDELHDRNTVAANLDYYVPRTDHGSSLSLAVHSLAASRVGRTGQAYEFFRRAAAIDLADAMSNGHHGVHAATQGGLLQAALTGFAGLHLDGDQPHLEPRLPEHWRSLGFSFVYQGKRYEREARGSKPTRRDESLRVEPERGGYK